jgi:hypothetical protein
MIRLKCFAVVAAVTATAALADLPPPADDYIGPRHVTLAGLNFEHRLAHYSRVIDHAANPSFVVLVGCEGASRNCDLVTKSGVMDWEVVSVDGKPIAQGDLNTVIAAFGTGHGPVEILFVHNEGAKPPRHLALKLDRG